MDKEHLISLAKLMMWACLIIAIKDVILFAVLITRYQLTNNKCNIGLAIFVALMSIFFGHMADKFRNKRNELIKS